MAEIGTVVSFLKQTNKGRLNYDRDWASSKEGVERVLREISLGMSQINIESRREEEQDGDDSYIDPLPLSPEVSATKKEPSLGGATKTAATLSSPHSNLSQTAERDDLASTRTLTLNHSTFDKTNKMTPKVPIASGVASPSSGVQSISQGSPVYFDVQPFQVSVNRDSEIDLDSSRQFVYGVDTSSTSSSCDKTLGRESDSFDEEETSDSSVFIYNQGFLKKVVNTPVSVNLVKLRLDDVNALLGITPDHEGQSDDASSEDEDDFPDSESLQIDRKLVDMREKMRADVELKNAAILRKFRDTSTALAEEADRRYIQEVKIDRDNLLAEEQRVLMEIKRDKEEASRREQEQLVQEQQRRKEVEELLRQCKEQEDKIREEEERDQRIQQQVNQLATLRPPVEGSVVALVELWNSVADKTKLSSTSRDVVSLANEVNNQLDALDSKAQGGELEDLDWNNLNTLIEKIPPAINLLQEEIMAIEAAEKEEAAAAAEAKAAAAEAEAVVREQQETPVAQPAEQTPPGVEGGKEEAAAEVNPISHPSTPKEPSLTAPSAHLSLQQFHEDIPAFKVKYIEDILFTDQEKKIKSELTHVITTTLNAISAQTTDHINDKLERLASLLAGGIVKDKEAQICAASHRSGIKYCTALLAKKIVRHGEEVVSSKAETAYPFASVALSLWDTYPDFGKLLLAYFYEFCPFLNPLYIPPKQDQAQKEYYESLGYKYDNNGVVEKQDKYLKRMTGLTRLFAAISASYKPLGSNTVHPYGPSKIWSLLTCLLKRDPTPDTTATILLVVFETTGNFMYDKYRSQFHKLLCFVREEYLPKLEAVKNDGGPTIRLETFLNQALNSRSVDRPKGLLGPGFIRKLNG